MKKFSIVPWIPFVRIDEKSYSHHTITIVAFVFNLNVRGLIEGSDSLSSSSSSSSSSSLSLSLSLSLSTGFFSKVLPPMRISEYCLKVNGNLSLYLGGYVIFIVDCYWKLSTHKNNKLIDFQTVGNNVYRYQ